MLNSQIHLTVICYTAFWTRHLIAPFAKSPVSSPVSCSPFLCFLQYLSFLFCFSYLPLHPSNMGPDTMGPLYMLALNGY